MRWKTTIISTMHMVPKCGFGHGMTDGKYCGQNFARIPLSTQRRSNLEVAWNVACSDITATIPVFVLSFMERKRL